MSGRCDLKEAVMLFNNAPTLPEAAVLTLCGDECLLFFFFVYGTKTVALYTGWTLNLRHETTDRTYSLFPD